MFDVLFFFFSLAIGVFGWIMLVVNGFKTSVVWGVCNLLIPGAFVVFAFMHRETRENYWLKQEDIAYLACVLYGITVLSL